MTLFPYITAVDNGAKNGRVSGRAADTFFFETLNQRWFGVAGRWRRVVANGVDGLDGDAVADLQRRKQRFFFVFGFFFYFLVCLAVTGKGDGGAAGREFAVGWSCACADAAHLDGERGAVGIGHLRSNGSLPDEAVERQFVGAKFVGKLVRAAKWKRGTNCFVSFLCIFHF